VSSSKIILVIVLATLGLWQAGNNWRLRPIHPPDGLLAPAEPRQSNPGSTAAISHGHWILTPRAQYEITARILGREDYSFDVLADLVPEDLALGWGAMSDNRILRDFQITQSARFYGWRPLGDLPIPRQEIISHSANTHVIPSDPDVRSQLESLRVGQIVHMTGLLVDGVRGDGVYIHTSLTRDDSGAGACEVMLVQRVEIL
jgi:hypothetical protein